jgi:hypothetical protein
MSRNHAHHDRGPPVTADALVEADEIVVRPELVTADPGLVVIGPDAVVVGPDEVTIEPEVILIRCNPPRRKRPQRSKHPVSKGSPQTPR